MKPIIPPLKPIPAGATKEDRHQMFEDYKKELARLNPHLMNADGTRKTFMQRIRHLFR